DPPFWYVKRKCGVERQSGGGDVLIHQLGHLEHRDLVLATEDRLQLGVRPDGPTVFRILQVVLLDVIPHLLGKSGTGERVGPDDSRQDLVRLHGLCESSLSAPCLRRCLGSLGWLCSLRWCCLAPALLFSGHLHLLLVGLSTWQPSVGARGK